ncbi:BofC C-terminal domain-containing protein [Anaerotruncus colihominis]|uniref:BofC C-terminal domain-containing protein n=1 Tax=Anaerotruncus colihominis TaxID=169435 RepID=UPI003513F367
MRNAILLTLIGVIAVSLITIGVVYALPPQTPSVLTPSDASSEQTVSEDPSNYPYLLRAYEGKLAVFTDDLVQPELVFDVYVRTLPELDQEQLSRGIRVKTYDELTSMIEDYIS